MRKDQKWAYYLLLVNNALLNGLWVCRVEKIVNTPLLGPHKNATVIRKVFNHNISINIFFSLNYIKSLIFTFRQKLKMQFILLANNLGLFYFY